MTTNYTIPDPLPERPTTESVWAVIYRWPGGVSWTLHRSVSSATGKVGGILGQAPKEWHRDDSEPYLWRRRPEGYACDHALYSIVVEEREVLP